MSGKMAIHTDLAPKAIGSYSQAVAAGNLVFVSGQIPLDPITGIVIEGDIKVQTRRIMENAASILAAAGCSFQQVVKATIYLRDMADFGAVNEVYGVYFGSEPPARATVAVAGLPKNAALEIDFIAWKA